MDQTDIMTARIPSPVAERFREIARENGLQVRALGAHLYQSFVADFDAGKITLTPLQIEPTEE